MDVMKITGAAACGGLAALLVKYPVRKLGLSKTSAQLMKAHEAASGVFFLAASAHMLMGLRGSRKAVVTGMAAYLTSVALIADCHMTHDKRKMDRHRLYSLLLAAFTAAHIC